MCKILFILSIVFLSFSVKAQLSNHIVIAEIYGGGGNASSHWEYDYIVLYNPTLSSVDLSAWSVQYAAATGSSWEVTNLSGSIEAESYYLIREAQGSGGDAPLPVTPNVIGDIIIAAMAGKVAVVSNQDEIADKSDPDIIDFVGYGSANEYEGSGSAPSPSNTSSIRRKDNLGNQTYGSDGSGWDTDINEDDFYEESDIVTNSPLPVELTSFTASASNDKIHLNWRTASEVNNYGFDIERASSSTSPGQDSWKKIGFIKGHGNSNSVKEYYYTDKNISTLGKYFYRLKEINTDGSFKYSKVVDVNFSLPSRFTLSQNYPNPFNPVTNIRFEFDKNSKARLTVYDVLGNRVAGLFNGNAEAGKMYKIKFDGSTLSSGVYYYKLTGGNETEIKKMILLK